MENELKIPKNWPTIEGVYVISFVGLIIVFLLCLKHMVSNLNWEASNRMMQSTAAIQSNSTIWKWKKKKLNEFFVDYSNFC